MKHSFFLILTCALCLVFSAGCDDDTSTPEPTDNSATDNTDTGATNTADAGGEENGDDADGPWGTTCAEDGDCAAPTDLCVMQPGDTEGYCSIACPNLGADCTHADWTCNIIGTCDAPAATWCGPPSEVDEGGGFVVACE